MRWLAVLLCACGLIITPIANAEPDNVTKGKVWVDPRVDEAPYVYDMVANQLNPDDRIEVNIEYKGPAYVKPNCTHIIVFANGIDNSVAVYGDTNWPDHKTAVEILSRSENDWDEINRALRLIREIHAWQAAHPIGG